MGWQCRLLGSWGGGGGQFSVSIVGTRNVRCILDLQLNDPQADVEGRFVEQTDSIPVGKNLLRGILSSAVQLCILAISDNAHVHLYDR